MKRKLWSSVIVVVSLFATITRAQESCPDLVTKALSAINTNCDTLQRNSVCYGYNLVQASFVDAVADDFFTQPADRASILDIATLKTAPLSTTDDRWGVAVMSVQANVPNSLPGQAVTFVLLGDVELENATNPEDAFVPPDPIEVIVNQDARLRSGGGFNFNTVDIAPVNTVLGADATSADGEWLRVVYNELPLWINRSVVTANADLSTLPALDGTQRTSMQAFYLRTGIGEVGCEQAQSTLLVQGPKNIKIDLTVNGANMTVGSTVLFRTPSPNQMQITVLDGEVTVYDQGENGEDVTFRTGFTTEVCLSDPDNLGVDGESNDRMATCGISEPIENDFVALGDEWCHLEGIPADDLNYPVDLLCEGEDEATYLENVLDETPTETTPAVDDSEDEQAVVSNGGLCDGLSLSSPLNGIPFGLATFKWSAGVGIEQYALNMYGIDGAQIFGTFVNGDETSFVFDSTSVAGADRAQWEILGLIGGQVVCGTGRTSILQRADPPPPVVSTGGSGSSSLVGSWSCDLSSTNVPFSYSGADASDTVTLTWTQNGGAPFFGSPHVSGGASGGVTLDCAPCATAIIAGVLTASPSGLSYTMPTLTNCGNF